ncbi:hypothetical protein JAAARDRAFT_206791 [Jaapia argillacea MUCL 33604]|uniref:Uncharacterized protein n=1 Tax=Jaapia argillacea MUCL 33604 TaxID=933084 RepID=A0A067PTB8_9AGAM|nr:hypothetical protein JAAARDRAFT_206791 [Jaapia argillacea MUCL 33604]
MSTRKRTNRADASPSPSAVSSTSHVQSSSDLPPPRERRGMKKVRPPGSNIRLENFIYIMALIALAVVGFYSWRIWSLKAEVGGWWNLALGRRPPAGNAHGGGGYDAGNAGKWTKSGGSSVEVESRIEELAKALGMPSKELASAIAGAVRDYVPPATLSSISAQARKTNGAGSPVVDELLGEHSGGDEQGVAGGVAETLGKVVGLDEPPEPGM